MCLALASCSQVQQEKTSEKANQQTEEKIRVGVFEGNGGAQTCIWETMQAVSLDPQMQARTITTAEIASGALKDIDVIVIPGGGGSRQYLNLGEENHKRIKEFVEKGGGAVGICAGAFLFSNTPDYSCLEMNGMKAIDIEHDNRGHGVVKVTLTEKGKEIFYEVKDKDTLYFTYYEGPVFEKNTESKITTEVYAMMQSDVHEEGNAPENMTNNKPFFTANQYGNGRVFCTIAHPENTPGMIWVIPRMIRWSANKQLITYNKQKVDPDFFKGENLMSKQDLEKESNCFKTLLYGTEKEKIQCLDFLESKHSWDAKRWLQGLVFDSCPRVRERASRYIANISYLQYLPELKVALKNENDPQTKKQLQDDINKLEALREK